jgi:hypothetical protein
VLLRSGSRASPRTGTSNCLAAGYDGADECRIVAGPTSAHFHIDLRGHRHGAADLMRLCPAPVEDGQAGWQGEPRFRVLAKDARDAEREAIEDEVASTRLRSSASA